MFCFGMLFLISITRIIKIFFYKKVENPDDVLLVLMFGVFIAIFAYIYHYIKRKFKKEPEQEIKDKDENLNNFFNKWNQNN